MPALAQLLDQSILEALSSGIQRFMLDKLADYYDEEVEMSVQSLMAAMEPMIIIVLAVVVGGLIAACMMPMMSMYTALDNL